MEDATMNRTEQNPRTGRWYITMGHPGFNSPANNRNGYATEASARAASERYGSRGPKLPAEVEALIARKIGGAR